MYEIDWTTPPTFERVNPFSKKEKFVSDIQMILEPSNLFPLNGWFDIWKQLCKDIVSK